MPLSPFQQFGIAAGGLAEGFASGFDMMDRVMQRRETQRQHQQTEQTRRMDEALKLLNAGQKAAEAGDTNTATALIRLAGDLDNRFRGFSQSTFDPRILAERQAEQTKQAFLANKKTAEALGLQPGTHEYQQIVFGKTLGGDKDMIEVTVDTPEGPKTGKVPLEMYYRMKESADLRLMLKSMGGPGRGGAQKDPASAITLINTVTTKRNELNKEKDPAKQQAIIEELTLLGSPPTGGGEIVPGRFFGSTQKPYTFAPLQDVLNPPKGVRPEAKPARKSTKQKQSTPTTTAEDEWGPSTVVNVPR